MAARRVIAFAPGRVNVIGEHTDYNEGLALPFAIEQGVTVGAVAVPGEDATGERVEALALDLDERDSFLLREPGRAEGWRAFVRGAVAELTAAGARPPGARLEISGDVPRGGGLSSSAAMTVALCLALLELDAGAPAAEELRRDPVALAQLCSRVENEWTGAHTGLLDQLASLCGSRDVALLIDFRTPRRRAGAPRDGRLALRGRGLGRTAHAFQLRLQRAPRGVRPGVRAARRRLAARHPGRAARGSARATRGPRPPRLEENARVLAATRALRDGDMPALAGLLNASHASLRDLYAVSTPAVEATVAALLETGAVGARLIGGGFGGSVLALFEPQTPLPDGAVAVAPGPGAHAQAA